MDQKNSRLQSMIGYKFFREVGDEVELIRLVHVKKYKEGNPAEVTVRDEGTGLTRKIRVDALKEYQPLVADGLVTFNIVNVKSEDGNLHKDVIITGSKILNIQIGDTLPYVVCRQSITDVFYNLVCKTDDDMITGLSINQDDCPANFDFRIMLACDGIGYSENINFYRTDTIDDILGMVKVHKFDAILEDLYNRHVEASGNPLALMKKQDKGWCKDLVTLLTENSFQNDLNEMLGITSVDFNIAEFITKKPLPGKEDETYDSITDDFKFWLSNDIFKINIDDVTIIEYGHDINLGDFNDSRYLLLRDNTNTLYLLVYTSEGEFHEVDLQAESEVQDFSTKFRLSFYNKYNNNK